MREDIGVAVDEHGYVVYYNGMEEAHEEREETMDTNRIGVNESDGEESDGEPPINESIVHHEEIVADVANGDEKAYEEASSTSVVAPKRSGSPLLARSAKHYKTGESSSNHQVEDYETPEDDECQNGVSFSNNSTSLSTQQQLEISQFQPLLAAVQKTVHEVFAVEAKKMVTLVLDEQKKRSEAEKKSSLEEEKVSMTSYIKGLKRLVANMNSPSLDNIELRIDNALVALYDKDEVWEESESLENISGVSECLNRLRSLRPRRRSQNVRTLILLFLTTASQFRMVKPFLNCFP